VTVNSDGTLNLNGQTDAVAALNILGGQGTTGATGAGQLTAGSLNMTGGSFAAVAAGSSLILGGNVIATSTPAGPATISGSGTLSVGGAPRTITVNPGPQAVGLDVSAALANTSGGGLIKSGTGVLELDANSVTAG